MPQKQVKVKRKRPIQSKNKLKKRSHTSSSMRKLLSGHNGQLKREEDVEDRIPEQLKIRGKEENILKFLSLYNRGMDRPLRQKMFKMVFPAFKEI